MIDHFYILSFSHKNMDVSEVGKLHIEAENQEYRLNKIKEEMNISEMMFLSTCNRVEFLICTEQTLTSDFLVAFFSRLYTHYPLAQITSFVNAVAVYHQIQAIDHILQVASSIDSMIVGEREIITQVRTSYENSKSIGITGDFIRLVMRHTVETAK